MTTPQRIQRKRTKGWRMPEGAIYVGRPTRWGNPFLVHAEEIVVHADGRSWWDTRGAVTCAVELYRERLGRDMRTVPSTRAELRQELGGHNLACWCPIDQPCHADVLLEIANGPAA